MLSEVSPLQRLVVGELGRLQPEALLDGGRVVDHGIGHAAPIGDHPHVVVHELEGVQVPAHDPDLVAGALTGARERADDVVRFVAGMRDDRDAKRLEQLARELGLPDEIIRRRRALRLVVAKRLVAKGASALLGDEDDVGALLLQQAQEHIREAVHGVGGRAVGGAKGRQREEGAIEQAVAVDQD